MNFDKFSWTNHSKRRLGRIPSQKPRNRPEIPLPPNCEMFLKIVTKFIEIHIYFKKEWLNWNTYRIMLLWEYSENLNPQFLFFFVMLDSFSSLTGSVRTLIKFSQTHSLLFCLFQQNSKFKTTNKHWATCVFHW